MDTGQSHGNSSHKVRAKTEQVHFTKINGFKWAKKKRSQRGRFEINTSEKEANGFYKTWTW